jgi:hypothetical protein
MSIKFLFSNHLLRLPYLRLLPLPLDVRFIAEPLTMKHMIPQHLVFSLLLSFYFLRSEPFAIAEDLIESITVQTLHQNLEGSDGQTWFHPKACMIPGKDGNPPIAFMTKQVIGGSDYFNPVHWSISNDQGRTWSKALPFRPSIENPLQATKGLWLESAMWSRNIMRLQILYWPWGKLCSIEARDFRERINWQGIRCMPSDVQMAVGLNVAISNGTIHGAVSFIPITAGKDGTYPMETSFLHSPMAPESQHRSVAGVLCSFDGELLKIKKVGPPIETSPWAWLARTIHHSISGQVLPYHPRRG